MTQLSTVCIASTLNNKILSFNGHLIHFNYRTLSYMEYQKIQPYVMKPDDSDNNQTHDNALNTKLNYLYNDSKVEWIMNYGKAKHLPPHMESILEEAWDVFKVYSGITITYRFIKAKLPPPSPIYFSTNTQACVSSVKVSSRSKD